MFTLLGSIIKVKLGENDQHNSLSFLNDCTGDRKLFKGIMLFWIMTFAHGGPTADGKMKTMTLGFGNVQRFDIHLIIGIGQSIIFVFLSHQPQNVIAFHQSHFLSLASSYLTSTALVFSLITSINLLFGFPFAVYPGSTMLMTSSIS